MFIAKEVNFDCSMKATFKERCFYTFFSLSTQLSTSMSRVGILPRAVTLFVSLALVAASFSELHISHDLDNRKCVLPLFIDFTRVFETINRGISVDRPYSIEIRGLVYVTRFRIT